MQCRSALSISRLHGLYADESKHSRYQNVPEFVRQALGYEEAIDELWRGDTARYRYLQAMVDFSRGVVVDVGANTGFFTLSLAREHPQAHFIAVEGNENHVSFIQNIAETFLLGNVETRHFYATRDTMRRLPPCDTLILLNVLHHAGVDFDQDVVSEPGQVAAYATECLSHLRAIARRLVFQMGYNWGGNKKKPIVALEADAEKIVYTSDLLMAAGWSIERVAVARATEELPMREYRDLPEEALAVLRTEPAQEIKIRAVGSYLDAGLAKLSEFYRRPLFTCTAAGR